MIESYHISGKIHLKKKQVENIKNCGNMRDKQRLGFLVDNGMRLFS